MELLDEETLNTTRLLNSLSEIQKAEVVLAPSLETKPTESPSEKLPHSLPKQKREVCWYLASAAFLCCSILLATMSYFSSQPSAPMILPTLEHTSCDVLSNEKMINASVADNYVQNFDKVRKNLNLACNDKERFVFFYGDKLQKNGLGRVFLAHCAANESNPFSYCDNYFYYSWKPQ